MKCKYVLLAAVTSLICASAFAGGPDFKQVTTPPSCEYGTGWYFAIDGGANVHQNFDDHLSRTFANGDVIDLHIDSDVGGYGGIKLGYVFGTGTFRFALEEDMLYNGFSTDSHLDLNHVEVARNSNMINSGAFLTNFIGRYAMGKFQPYVGGGVGAYYAETNGGDFTIVRPGGKTFSTGGGRNSGSLAWDVVAGADYFWTCKFSTFIEYHYLGYVALDVGDGSHQFGNHLVGAGIKFHF
jgi:hypothetical protein